MIISITTITLNHLENKFGGIKYLVYICGMKIKVNKETFINVPCPKITRRMWNWYYSNLYTSARNLGGLEGVTKIDTIDIRINTSYGGAYNVHFYTSINGGEEFYMPWDHNEPRLLDEFDLSRMNISKKYRYDWIVDFVVIGRIDMGTTSPIERKNARYAIFDMKEKSKKRTNQLVSDWNQYIKLKEYFE